MLRLIPIIIVIILSLNAYAENGSAKRSKLEQKIESPIVGLKEASSELKKLKLEEAKVKKDIELKRNETIVKERKKVITTLKSEKNKLGLQIKELKGFNYFGTGLKSIMGISALAGPLCILLVALYLWLFKRDMVFKISPGEMIRKCVDYIKPPSFKGIKERLKEPTGLFLTITGVVTITLIIAILILFTMISAVSAETLSDRKQIPLWNIHDKSFEENLLNASRLIEMKMDYDKLIFTLKHPLRDKIVFKDLSVYQNLEGLVFRRMPEFVYKADFVRRNSFEHLFLLGRLYYEAGKKDIAFGYFNSLKRISDYKFTDPAQASDALLNMLKIAYLERRDAEFTGLLNIFLSDSANEDIALLITFLLDNHQEKCFRLFKQRIKYAPLHTIPLLDKVVEKKGYEEEGYPYFEAYYEEIIGNKRLTTDSLLEKLTDIGYAVQKDKKPSIFIGKYNELIKRSIYSSKNINTVLYAYSYLSDVGEKEFVINELNNLFKDNMQLKSNMDLYTKGLDIYYKTNERSVYITNVEKSYTTLFVHSYTSLYKLLLNTLEKREFSLASEVLDQIFLRFNNKKHIHATPSLIAYLDIDLPHAKSGLSFIGFSGLLNYKIKNVDKCKTSLEEAIHPNLTDTLSMYGNNLKVNINEIYFLMKIYSELGLYTQLEVALPIYERLVDIHLGAIISDIKSNITLTQKRVDGLKSSLDSIAADEKLFKKLKKDLEKEISQLKSNKESLSLRKSMMNILLYTARIISATIGFFLLIYSLGRAGYYASNVDSWRSTIFTLRFVETIGFIQCMSVIGLPIGLIIVILAQYPLSHVYKNIEKCKH